MKILIVTPIYPPEIGGPATYSHELLQRLPPKIEVKIVSFGPEDKSYNNIQIVSTRGGFLIRQSRFFLALLKHTPSVDLVYIQEPVVVGLGGVLVARVFGKKVLTKYVGDPSWENYQNNEGSENLIEYLKDEKNHDWRFKICKLVLDLSEKIITPGAHLGEILAKNYQVKKNKIAVIPNSVEIQKLSSRKKKGQVIFIGRLVVWKNVSKVLEAIKFVADKKIEVSLLIIGSGPEEEHLKNSVKTLGLKSVRFLGSLGKSETQKKLAESEILVLFSSYEGLSHVLLEAQGSAVAVVASDIPGNKEAIINGKTGFLARSGDSQDLARKIEKLLINATLRMKMESAGQQLITRQFSWATNLDKLKKEFL